MSNKAFWQGGFGKLLRWLTFLPLAFLSIGILQHLPVKAVIWASGYKPEFSFLTLIIGLIALSILGTLGWLWFLGLSMTPYLTCGVIAPNNKIATVIFGTLFCLFQGLFLFGVFYSDAHWIYKVYMLVVSIIVIGSTVVAYQEDS